MLIFADEMGLKITFLGTGTSQGIPVIASDHPVCLSGDKRDKRLRVSIMIEWDNFCYIIDCGPDFRYQMLRANVHKIDGILFTHEHADHTAGLDDIRPFSFKMGKVPLYANEDVFRSLQQRFEYIFKTENRYPGAPSIEKHLITNSPFNLNDKTVIPVHYLHGKLPVFGYKIDQFAYITDIKFISEKEKEKLKNLEVLVISVVKKGSHHSHMSYEEVMELIKELHPKKSYITHLSHTLGFHKDLEKELPKNVFPAYDGLIINL